MTWICQQAQVELTITIIHAVRDQFKQTNKDKQGWFLGNLVTELTNYLDQLPSSQPEEMTEEEAEQLVLWSRHPSKIITMMERGENTIEDHWQELVWMSHSEAREYGYDSPLARRYTPEEIERYKQLTSQQTACIAQKAGSYEHTHLSHTAANAVESTCIFLTQPMP